MKEHVFRSVVKTCAAVLLVLLSPRVHAQPSRDAPQTVAAAEAIPEAELLQPQVLEQILQSSSGEKPLILQVGSHVLYAEAHLPGSEYAGAAGQDAGLQALQERVKAVERNKLIVIYCGCCPWNRCPNIRPAYQKLRALGFTRVKVLYIATNFGTDWVSRGYPVAKGR